MSKDISPERERYLLALALGHALAVRNALADTIGESFLPEEDVADMKAILEVLVRDDAELEELTRTTSWRVGHLVGFWPPRKVR